MLHPEGHKGTEAQASVQWGRLYALGCRYRRECVQLVASDLVIAFVRHLKGGLAVSTSTACALFGAVSGSTQATFVAVGGPLRPRMLKAGYKDSFILVLIVNSSDIAFLIPPSIGMIMYGVVSKSSIPELFIAGKGPGLLTLMLFSLYSMAYATIKRVPTEPAASWRECFSTIKRAIWPPGFPFIIIGGIFGGVLSPTEAAAVSVLYAFFLEAVAFRTVGMGKLYETAKFTSLVTAVVFILVGAGAAFVWVLSYAQIPQEVLNHIGVEDMSANGVLLVIAIAFFIGCMFVDPIVVILILVPIFMPAIKSTGLDPIPVGIVITLQAAIRSATPPHTLNQRTSVSSVRDVDPNTFVTSFSVTAPWTQGLTMVVDTTDTFTGMINDDDFSSRNYSRGVGSSAV